MKSYSIPPSTFRDTVSWGSGVSLLATDSVRAECTFPKLLELLVGRAILTKGRVISDLKKLVAPPELPGVGIRDPKSRKATITETMSIDTFFDTKPPHMEHVIAPSDVVEGLLAHVQNILEGRGEGWDESDVRSMGKGRTLIVLREGDVGDSRRGKETKRYGDGVHGAVLEFEKWAQRNFARFFRVEHEEVTIGDTIVMVSFQKAEGQGLHTDFPPVLYDETSIASLLLSLQEGGSFLVSPEATAALESEPTAVRKDKGGEEYLALDPAVCTATRLTLAKGDGSIFGKYVHAGDGKESAGFHIRAFCHGYVERGPEKGLEAHPLFFGGERIEPEHAPPSDTSH